MNKHIILITGGARSGKSAFAERLAENVSKAFSDINKIAYIATAEAMDDEFKNRISIHRQRRGNIFQTYEESIEIHNRIKSIYNNHNIFILECLTTWLGNLFFKLNELEIESYIKKTIEQIMRRFSKKIPANSDYSNDLINQLMNCEKGGFSNPVENLLINKKNKKVLIIVSNEIGLGIVPDKKINRDYRDVHGRLNKLIASIADFVYFTISGIPVRIK